MKWHNKYALKKQLRLDAWGYFFMIGFQGTSKDHTDTTGWDYRVAKWQMRVKF